jgi:hypothetical protein
VENDFDCRRDWRRCLSGIWAIRGLRYDRRSDRANADVLIQETEVQRTSEREQADNERRTDGDHR